MFHREDKEAKSRADELAARKAELERQRQNKGKPTAPLPPPPRRRHTEGLEEPMPRFRPPSKEKRKR